MMNPFKIDRHIPIPTGRQNSRLEAVRQTLSEMKPGDSFHYDHNRPDDYYRSAKTLRLKIKSQKQPTGGWRIWLIGKAK